MFFYSIWIGNYEILILNVFVHTKNAEVFVYKGSQAVDLIHKGLLVEPAYHFPAPVNWSEIFNLTIPV